MLLSRLSLSGVLLSLLSLFFYFINPNSIYLTFNMAVGPISDHVFHTIQRRVNLGEGKFIKKISGIKDKLGDLVPCSVPISFDHMPNPPERRRVGEMLLPKIKSESDSSIFFSSHILMVKNQ